MMKGHENVILTTRGPDCGRALTILAAYLMKLTKYIPVNKDYCTKMCSFYIQMHLVMLLLGLNVVKWPPKPMKNQSLCLFLTTNHPKRRVNNGQTCPDMTLKTNANVCWMCTFLSL